MNAPVPATDLLQMLHQHQPLLRRVARLYEQDPDDRQDLFQEVVRQLWRAWPRYEPRADVKLSTWLYRVARNVAISDLRRRTCRPPHALICLLSGFCYRRKLAALRGLGQTNRALREHVARQLQRLRSLVRLYYQATM